jgi:diguanylate cyclase (GGDEF)-like protein
LVVTPNKCTVLVVDDESIVLTTLQNLLAREFEVLTADSAEAAMQVLAAREVDIVLTDHRMPGKSGVQLLEWVRHQAPATIRLIMTGMARLEDVVEAINFGQVHRFVVKPWRNEEILEVLRNASRTFLLERSHEQLLDELRQLNVQLEERVQQRTQELEEANRQLELKNAMLEKLALTDPLTGLPNRRAMDRLARAEVRRRDRYPSPLTLGLLDVDFFKEVNSRYLLPGGDRVLVGLAQTLNSSIRTVDTVGRVGGEEFMLLAPQTDPEGAIVLGERVRSGVERTGYVYKDATIHITVSVGLAVAEETTAIHFEQLRDMAAAALEKAKSAGRNRCVILRYEEASVPERNGASETISEVALPET